MIISHKHKFIFVKTKKTAGTSIEIALSSICGPEDVITPISEADEQIRQELGFRGPQNYKLPIGKYDASDRWSVLQKKRTPKFYNHMTCKEMVKYVEPEIWNSYFKFAFDRNPFDKVVSLIYWRGQDQQYNSISEFIRDGALEKINGFDAYSISKVLAVDKVYKFEEIPQAFEDISKRLKLDTPLEPLSYKAKSGTRKKANYKEVLDEEAIKLIELAFAREIKLLGYSFD